MNLTAEQKAIGRDNYYEALGVNRRDFMKDLLFYLSLFKVEGKAKGKFIELLEEG